MSFTCDDCGTSGSERWMRTHDCRAVQDVTAFGGRCEDYPCCGHAPGECAPQESFTKEYWQDRYDALALDLGGWDEHYPGEEY